MNFVDRSLAVWSSYRRLPLWVQGWVAVLVVVNAASFALLGTDVGKMTALAAVFVVLTNVPIMYAYRGMNKLMSVPHLFAWIPLQAWLLAWLMAALNGAHQANATSSAEFFYATTVVVINGISLLFDFKDSWEWLNGERSTP